YFHHKNDTTSDKQTIENLDEGVRPIRPLPKRTINSTELGHQAYLPTGVEHPLARPAGRANLSASQWLHSLPSNSMVPSWANIPFSTPAEMATVSLYPAQPVGSLGISVAHGWLGSASARLRTARLGCGSKAVQPHMAWLKSRSSRLSHGWSR
ncbi:hypothetical protein PQX77_019657, partial [Marasmius sp. AFHP31]